MRVSIVDAIAREATARPDRTAVAGSDVTLTYGRLARAATGLAGLLAAADRRRPVGVLVPRGALQLTAMLGVLFAGRPYVCLDDTLPRSRLHELLDLCSATTVVTQSPELLPAGVRAVPADLGLWSASPPGPSAPTDLDDPAYLIFTSGSTGPPKAVVIAHRGLENYAAHVSAVVGAAGSSRPDGLVYATVTALSTDLGHTAVFPALYSGASVRIVPEETVRDPFALVDAFEADPVDVLKVTPSLLDALLEANEPAVLPARVLVIGGEALRWRTVDRVREFSGCRILNHYGPTEATIGCLIFDVGEATTAHRALSGVPIGRPIANSFARVVRRPDDEPDQGELVVGGPGVALGYAGHPGDRRFGNDQATGLRTYRTGDIVRSHPDGVLEFIGRADRQLKVRGHRVEPGEIEAALHDEPEVRAAVVVASAEPTRLTAYVVAADPNPAELADSLLRRLRARLPAVLVPAALKVVSELPRSPSGKHDIRALEGI